MAFNLGNRFPGPPKLFTVFEPGAYQNDYGQPIKKNRAPFNAKSKRITQPGNKIWTHSLYYPDVPSRIPNCFTMRSKTRRFPYDAFNKYDVNKILCDCGVEFPCKCIVDSDSKFEDPGKQEAQRRLFVGHPPRSHLGEGLSAPSKLDMGFEVLENGTIKRIRKVLKNESPPFYNIHVDESSAYYHGCKWSKRTSGRLWKSSEVRPGPADYNIEKKVTDVEICAEKTRAYRRKTSKQYRFLEIVQRQVILEGRPGPGSYSPCTPSGTRLLFLGPKEERFVTRKYDISPCPADYSIKRDFDVPIPPTKPCHAKLPKPPFFGVKATRFKHEFEEGPSPFSYCPSYNICKHVHCPTAPFGSSAMRFKTDVLKEYDMDELLLSINEQNYKQCPVLSWMFKSKTKRLQPLLKEKNKPSPADFSQPQNEVRRSPKIQYLAPFFSSEGRFQPWNNWIPVHSRMETPGPCYYSLEKPTCKAYNRGPLFRTPRFQRNKSVTPAPNEYNNFPGIETILNTYNQRLKENIENKHKFVWQPPETPKQLSFEELETALLHQSIALLNVPEDTDKTRKVLSEKSDWCEEGNKPKLLRFFLRSQAKKR